MRTNFLSKRAIAVATACMTFVLLGTVKSNYGSDWWPFGNESPKSTAPVSVDANPISPQTKMATSIAPMVKRAAPSVVNVFSTKEVRTGDYTQTMPFFNDPLFRRFFGDPSEQTPNQAPRTRKENSLGSGVIVTADGYIITNNHVIDGADEIHISLANNRTEYPASIVGTDPKTDIAILKIEATDLPAITLTDSDHLEVGDFVAAIGNPFGVGQTVTTGIASAVGRGNIGITDYEDFIQTDASINPGNSGGALVDAEGRLVGINTAILSRSGGNQGIGFAVPINLVQSVMERILKHGRVVRGFLGVQIQEVTSELANAFGLDGQSGALVGDVIPDSAAAAAGILKGDVIVEFDGKKVDDVRHLRLMVARSAPGAEMHLKVIRNGKPVKVTAVLKEQEAADLASAGGAGGRSDAARELLKGIKIGDLNARTRQEIGAPPELSGTYVVEVASDCPAAEAGLRSGDLILEINHIAVTDAASALKASQGIRGDAVLLYVWNKTSGRRYLAVKAG